MTDPTPQAPERHEERTDKPGWDTKQRCTCGFESVSRAEQWKHAADALRDQLAAAEAEIADARLWGFSDGYHWYEDVIEWLGDWHDEESSDAPQDLIAEVKNRLAAADAVIEALEAAQAFRFSVHEGVVSTDAEWKQRTALWDAVANALATYRAKETEG